MTSISAEQLIALIRDFVAHARRGLDAMQRHYGVSDLMRAWRVGDVPQIGSVSGGEIEFYFHGYGCAITISGHCSNFDFVEDGNIAFNVGKLIAYTENEYDIPVLSVSEADIKLMLRQIAAAGTIKESRFHRGYYYLT